MLAPISGTLLGPVSLVLPSLVLAEEGAAGGAVVLGDVQAVAAEGDQAARPADEAEQAGAERPRQRGRARLRARSHVLLATGSKSSEIYGHFGHFWARFWTCFGHVLDFKEPT